MVVIRRLENTAGATENGEWASVRVLMVIDGLSNGGKERQLALLANSLPEPWSASVLSLEDGPYRAVLEAQGIEVHVVRRRHRYDVTPAAAMWRHASRIKPHVVHSWGWMSNAAMVPFCRARRVPLLNGTIRLGSCSAGRTRLDKLGMSLSDGIVANSRAGLSAFGVADDRRGRVVYNGFDTMRLGVDGHALREMGAHEGTVAIMAARMSPHKDWRSLFQVARLLADEAEWRFVAVGDGPQRSELVEEAADLVDRGAMAFPEGGLEVLPLIAAADVGVLLTDPRRHAEGCSNSIMEYMACGLPVVCTDSGGNPELVEDGVTGLLVAPQDEQALARALRTLGDDPTRAREMGLAGRRRLEELFTVDAMVAGFLAAYKSVLNGRGRPRP